MSNDSVIDLVEEMGFPRQRVELAYSRSDVKDVPSVTEWLLTHAEEETEVSSAVQEVNEAPPNEAAATSAQVDVLPSAKCIKCDDCNKQFNVHADVKQHVLESGHQNFSESSSPPQSSVEEKRPLSEDEKRVQLEKIEAKLKQRRVEREQREKMEALEREKKRIRSGKELLEAKQKQEDMEMRKMVEQRKREKEEDRMAKQRVREQIEADRLARREKCGEVVLAKQPLDTMASSTGTKAAANYNEVRLQIRLTDGSQLVHTFGAKEPLSAVRLFVEMNRSDTMAPFKMMTNAPRKIFNDEDYEKPLDVLNLGPAAVIIVQKS